MANKVLFSSTQQIYKQLPLTMLGSCLHRTAENVLAQLAVTVHLTSFMLWETQLSTDVEVCKTS